MFQFHVVVLKFMLAMTKLNKCLWQYYQQALCHKQLTYTHELCFTIVTSQTRDNENTFAMRLRYVTMYGRICP